MTRPLLRAAADASWEQAPTLEELAEPHRFTAVPSSNLCKSC
jgi:hypothetical protein